MLCWALIPLLGMAQKNLVSTERLFPKIDKVLEFEKALATHAQKYHKGDYSWVWVADNEKIAVYTASASGPPQITTVARLKDGLKELTPGYRKPIRERYDAVNGNDAWLNYLQTYEQCIDSRWSELLFYRAGLSSK